MHGQINIINCDDDNDGEDDDNDDDYDDDDEDARQQRAKDDHCDTENRITGNARPMEVRYSRTDPLHTTLLFFK